MVTKEHGIKDRNTDSTIVFVSGNFNILHPGHIRLFKYAKECGNYLIVGVSSDKISGNESYISEDLRLEGVSSISWVDESFIMSETVLETINSLKPNIVVKGKEHEQLSNAEVTILEQYGGKLLFGSGEMSFSSADLLYQEFLQYKNRTISLPRDYMTRHNIKATRLIELVESFQKLRVCVIGDLIVDEYITCQALGMSQEEPTLVVSPVDTLRFVGGAGIVAAHALGLGATVKFISVTGRDEIKNFAEKRLKDQGVDVCLFEDLTRPTTLKQRFRSGGKSLLRVSYLRQNAISLEVQDKIIASIEATIGKLDLLVFSDFNYGCLPQRLVDRIINIARNHGVIMAADSQSSSQVGDISRFRGVELITPTEFEARMSTRNYEYGLPVLVEKLKKLSNAKSILLKIGSDGVLVYPDTDPLGEMPMDRIQALNVAPRDVSGAGDSMLITSAMTLTLGGSLWEAACLGSLASALQVSRVGNTPIQKNELIAELTS